MQGQKFRLLVVDDEDMLKQSIKMGIPSAWTSYGVSSFEEIPKAEHFDAAFVDMHLSADTETAEGVKVIQQLSKKFPHLEIVAMSANLDRSIMESCLKAGASRFLPKPLGSEELQLVLNKIEALLLLKNAGSRGAAQTTDHWIGSSSLSQKVRVSIADMLNETSPILIEGESGTGKEVVAKLLHSQISNRPFIVVNAAAIPESVFESEFFGHVKGAFTGADSNKIGLAEAANEGDLFIDEIEALPMSQQAKLLRFLESGEIRRVGAKESICVNVRVIAATNRSLEQMVEKGQFREDLLWRISGQKINLPPLRDRKDDITDLAKHFIEIQRPKRNKELTQDAIDELKKYDWPGNVRELKRSIERLCIKSPLPILRSEDVQLELNTGLRPRLSPTGSALDLNLGLASLLANFEKTLIEQAMESTKDIEQIAKTLQISRSSLYKKIKDHNIKLD